MRSFKAVKVLPLVCLAFVSAGLFASEPSYAPTVERWGIQEIILHTSRHYDNPFQEVTLTSQFTCAAEQMKVTGFYDGESTWKIRFMPQQMGRCKFQTISNDPEINDRSGAFEVTSPDEGNHGPVRVAKTYHFSYSDGTPYFLLGTTLYNWLNRSNELQLQTLNTLSHSPFTKVRFGLFPKWFMFNHEEPTLYPYVETSPQKFDLDRFNPKFFQAAEARIAQLEKMGIEADIILFHPYDHLGFAAMDTEHDDAYIRYVVARLSAFRNVWWTMANEYDLFDPQMTRGLKIKDWDHMFQTLETSDPYHHLRGIHNFGKWYDHGKPWITHVIIQDGSSHPARRLLDARAKYGKPTVVDEYGYEGDNGQGWGILSGAEEVSRHWDITMAGGYGSHGETYVHPGGILWWAAGGTLVGESPARLSFLKQIMTDSPFQDLVPSPDLAQGGTLLADVGEYYLLRVKDPTYRPVEIHLKEGMQYRVDLIDPWLMKIYPLGYTEGGLQAFNLPLVPGLVRFQRTAVHGSEESAPVQTLIANFLSDSSLAKPPHAAPIQHQKAYYSAEYTIGELLDNPKTAALVKKYLPNLPSAGVFRALSVEQIMSFASLGNFGDLCGLAEELAKTPVEQ